MEKFDGTNLGKDKNGSRRLVLGKDKEEFIGTSLDSIKQVDVGSFHNELVKKLGISEACLLNTIIFGELMCNPDLHDYEKRGFSGRWLLFGAMLEVEGDSKVNIIEYSQEQDFTVKGKENTNQIRLYLNEKLAQMFARLGYDCDPAWIQRGTLINIVKSNKESLERGSVEGLVISMNEEDFTGNMKWKAAHCFQPVVEKR